MYNGAYGFDKMVAERLADGDFNVLAEEPFSRIYDCEAARHNFLG